MDSTDKNKLFVLAILLVLLASWVIGNFLYVMIESSADSDTAVISTDDIKRGIEDESSSNLFRILLSIIVVIIIIMLAVTIIGVLFESDLALLTQISVLILVILITTFIFTARLDDTEVDGDEGDPISSDIDIPGSKNIIEKTSPYGHIIFPFLLIGIFVLLINEFMNRSREEESIEEIEINIKNSKQKDVKNISSDLKDVRAELRRSKGVRDSIINAYKTMMKIFENEGIEFKPSMTSREFMNYAMKNLDVSDEIISDITNLFEEARYSSHTLDELYRERALNDLKKLEGELSRE